MKVQGNMWISCYIWIALQVTSYMCDFLVYYGCMVDACGFLVMCRHLHGDILGLTVVLALPCHFIDSHGVVGFST